MDRIVDFDANRVIILEKDGRSYPLKVGAGREVQAVSLRENGEVHFIDEGEKDSVFKALGIDGKIRTLGTLRVGGKRAMSPDIVRSESSRAAMVGWTLYDLENQSKDGIPGAIYGQVFNSDGKQVRWMELPLFTDSPASQYSLTAHPNDRFSAYLPGREATTFRVIDSNSKNDVELRIPNRLTTPDGKAVSVIANDVWPSRQDEYVVASTLRPVESNSSEEERPRSSKRITRYDRSGRMLSEFSTEESSQTGTIVPTSDGFAAVSANRMQFLDEKLKLKSAVQLPRGEGEEMLLDTKQVKPLTDGRVAVIRSAARWFDSDKPQPDAKEVLIVANSSGVQKVLDHLPKLPPGLNDTRLEALPDGKLGLNFKLTEEVRRFEVYDRNMRLIARRDARGGYRSQWLPDGTLAIQEDSPTLKNKYGFPASFVHFYKIAEVSEDSTRSPSACGRASTLSVDSPASVGSHVVGGIGSAGKASSGAR